MASSISTFMSSFTTELARPNRFDVKLPLIQTLTMPAGLKQYLRCENANLPSRTFATTEQKFGSNPIEKYPYQVTYNDVDMTFIVSGDMSEKKYFDAWHEMIMPSSTFTPSYKNTYSGNIEITQYDLLNNPSYTVTLIDAYPIVVNQLDLDWSSDGYHKLTVVFAYTYWSTSTTPILNQTPMPFAQ